MVGSWLQRRGRSGGRLAASGLAVGVALAAAALFLAPGPSRAAGLKDGVLEVELTQWSLGFQGVEVEAGELTVHVVNRGSLDHDLSVEIGAGGKQYVFRTGHLAPGQETTFRLMLPPGQYRLYCSVEGHDVAGMQARLIVKEPARRPVRRPGGYY